MEKQPKIGGKFDPSIQSEEIAFAADDLVRCAKCSRSNGPNRLKCLYCGAMLDVGVDRLGSLGNSFRKLESWELGCNVIVLPDASRMDVDPAELAKILPLETAAIDRILRSSTPLPIGRVESEKEAAMLQQRLSELAVVSHIIADAVLAPGKPPKRIRSVEFLAEAIVLLDFNTGKIYRIPTADVAVIVPGSITRSRLDSIEKKRRGGRTTLIDESATVFDEIVLDIYTRDDPTGFRVYPAGFDFSSLGVDKGLFARDNFRLLVRRLCDHAPGAKLVDTYADVRDQLGLVWEVAVQNDPRGLQRSGFGKREFARVMTTSNLDQFTRYSRLQWHLL